MATRTAITSSCFAPLRLRFGANWAWMFRIARCRQSGLFPAQQQSRLDISTASSSWCAGISVNTAMRWFSGTFLLHTKDWLACKDEVFFLKGKTVLNRGGMGHPCHIAENTLIQRKNMHAPQEVLSPILNADTSRPLPESGRHLHPPRRGTPKLWFSCISPRYNITTLRLR